MVCAKIVTTNKNIMDKRIITLPSIFIIFIVLSFGLTFIVYAQESPHGNYTPTTDVCAACHRTHTGSSAQLIAAPDEGNAFCNTCHDNVYAPAMTTHNNQTYSSRAEASFSLACTQCHEPHGSTNLENIKEAVQVNPAFNITTGPVVFTANTGTNSYDDGTSDPASRICVTCHNNSNNPGYPMSNHIGGDNHLNGNDYSAQDCTVCHPHDNGFMHGAAGSECIACHGHDAGTLYDPDASYPYTAGTEASQGNGSYQSHSTHTERDADDQRGPAIYCDSCHDTSNFPYFKSGTDNNGDGRYDLSETDVCDTCHSPGGSYNGVDDVTIGAKNNWANGIYAADGTFLPGKEKWCAGCHDEMPAVIQSVKAPNVIGNESAPTRYGTGFGYYKTGHGLSSDEVYPASGNPGAGIGCLDCHNSEMLHIDGIAKTYTPDSDYVTYDPVSANYQNGFRLSDVSTGYDNRYPMHIPRTGPGGFREDWEFALCFQCHNRDALLGEITDPNTNTNFTDHPNGEQWNSHNLHTDGRNGPGGPTTPQYDSNFDGIADSRISCPACHNVHGSPVPAMFRNGELVVATSPLTATTDIIPFLDFQYTPICGANGCTTLPESTGGAGTRFYTTGPGTVARNGICNMCHNEYWFDGANDGSSATGYSRTPVDATAPAILWVEGQIGSDTLAVTFSESVYRESNATGNLTPDNFNLTDVDNGRTIVTATHAAGDTFAFITLDAPLDPTDDIDTDTIEPVETAPIYDALGNTIAIVPVTIQTDTNPPSISHQNPADGATGVNLDSNINFALQDGESGINWHSFSFQLRGNHGYNQSFSNTDVTVSKTGNPRRYDIRINPIVDFGLGERITATVNVSDIAGNVLVQPQWVFTTTGSGSSMLILHPSGVFTDGGFATTGGTWADILDNNDGDTSYASACCGPSGRIFYVDMDNPTLTGNAIDSIKIYVYARYLDGPWPGNIPYAANVDIGFRTGVNTRWKGSVTTDTSGNYNLIASAIYNTDSDGNLLDLNDINTLQIAVKRNVAGSAQLRVTETYAEIVYHPDTRAPLLVRAAGQIGNNTITVTFSEGVYNGSEFKRLSPDDFILLDADDERRVVSVTHTAGEQTALLVLNSPLDAADDIGTDIVAIANDAAILDAAGNRLNVGEVIIEEQKQFLIYLPLVLKLASPSILPTSTPVQIPSDTPTPTTIPTVTPTPTITPSPLPTPHPIFKREHTIYLPLIFR